MINCEFVNKKRLLNISQGVCFDYAFVLYINLSFLPFR